jgi:hypothetical protein
MKSGSPHPASTSSSPRPICSMFPRLERGPGFGALGVGGDESACKPDSVSSDDVSLVSAVVQANGSSNVSNKSAAPHANGH